MSELTGKRALITGASSGIGAALARLLAADGVHLVLAARRRAALDEVAAECRARGVRVDVIVADLGNRDAATTLWTEASASGAIDICVNNAGFGYFRPFSVADWARDSEMLQLNITSLVELSRRFVVSRAGATDRGYLLNVASLAAFQAVPNMAVYAATKAFVLHFTEALHHELRGTAVSATCVCPGGTVTEFHAQAGAGNYGKLADASMISAEHCAQLALRAMRRRKAIVVTGWLNKISAFGVRLVPRWFASFMARRVMGKPRPGELPSRSIAA
ncbi:MAG: SDR family NAD(P)-dependent oxidoreductase [Kofleriaceae bacterium]